ncbi:MAG: hypothetical protein ACYCW6_26285 [Candidatus Xenobia bacterium]
MSSDLITPSIIPSSLRRTIASGEVPETHPAPVLRQRHRDLAAWWHPAANRRPHPGRALSA